MGTKQDGQTNHYPESLRLSDSRSLQSFSIEAQHPDDFVLGLLDTFPDFVLEAAGTHRASLKNPAKTQEESLTDYFQ